MTVKKIISFLVGLLLSVVLIATPAWAIDVVSGEQVELKATSNLGVPLHQTSSSSLIGRALDGTVAKVVTTAKNGNWVEIQLPDGQERWIVEKYISRVISSQPTRPQPEELVPEPQDNRENTALKSGEDLLTVAGFNVENLDPGDTERFVPLSELIVKNLAAPDIIVLTEIQDNDGSQNSQIVEATETYNKLINAIKSVGGPEYIAFDIAPERNADGGEPGGNIRVGYLYQPQRVSLAAGTVGTAIDTVSVLDGPKLSLNPARIDPTNSAFKRSRKPLAAEFIFNNNSLFVVGNHFVSQRDDNDTQRLNQANIVGDFTRKILAEDNNANVIVAGDLNDLNDSETIKALQKSGLKNLSDLLEENDRYTYKFRNRLQQLDYILVSQNLSNNTSVKFDIVHVNVNKPKPLSDHDPVLAQFQLPKVSSVVNLPVSSTPILSSLSGEALKSQLATEYRTHLGSSILLL
ncbi:endonuclease/exonuclease/phosphatase family protein [Nostoc sp. UHCC 0870]|uniref:endonuclease/exonuclease/phosphatase family protein n=1 Tax=Nostoc sp. UHCC 0870 TaxID=2914041 RepID=UPI001EE0CDC9|nr:endonuclease/exonuclease/phosphatase family protein [Nostoc sp. UHCC 0870]UKP00978.1 endonuclease/exonuclease/phosphatase family protein [Nostoc sp. UHCC 0870]